MSLHALRVPLAAQIVLHVLPGLREQLVPLQLRRKIKMVLGGFQMPLTLRPCQTEGEVVTVYAKMLETGLANDVDE